MRKVLILTSNYYIGNYIDGIGVRLWEIAQVLSEYYQITILSNKLSDFVHPKIKFKSFEEESWRKEIEFNDTIICSDMPDTRVLLYAYKARKQIISENAIPIEHLEFGKIQNSLNPNESYQDVVARFKLQVLVTDHFIVRAEIERATMIAAVQMMGRLNYNTYSTNRQLKDIMTYIPIGFNNYSEEHKKNVERESLNVDYIWNGGIWGFHDGVQVIDAISKLKKNNSSASILFMYKPNENQVNEEFARLSQRIDELELFENVRFLENDLQHYERDRVILSSKAFICIGRDYIENYTCHRLRLRDVFLYNKPIIVDGYGATANIVKYYNIGVVVNGQDELLEAMIKLKHDKSYYNSLVQKIKDVREKFIIENNIQNLLDFIDSSELAKDKSDGSEHNMRLTAYIEANKMIIESPSYPF